MAGRPGRDADVDPYARSAWRGKKPRPRGAAHILLARQAVEDADPGRADLWRHRMWQRGKREQCSGKCLRLKFMSAKAASAGRRFSRTSSLVLSKNSAKADRITATASDA